MILKTHYKIAVISLLMLLSNVLLAHQMSTSYFNVNFSKEGKLEGELQLRLLDLQRALSLDQDRDHRLLWAEVINAESEIRDFLSSSLSFQRNELICRNTIHSDWKIDSHFNENYLVLPVSAQCTSQGELSIAYSAFFDIDSNHKLIANVLVEEEPFLGVISKSKPSIMIDVSKGSTWLNFKEFAIQGFVHILIGVDHILFVICFMLAVFLGNKSFSQRQAFTNTVVLVSLFTLAHSITLIITALDFIALPSRWVEVGIALSIVLSALNNIFSLFGKLAWVTFGFGLLHGLGFAGVLGEIGLPGDQKVSSVLGFNLGVELGQLAIICILYPLLLAVRKLAGYRMPIYRSLSLLIAAVASFWVFQRF